jgi:hypothetical protein
LLSSIFAFLQITFYLTMKIGNYLAGWSEINHPIETFRSIIYPGYKKRTNSEDTNQRESHKFFIRIGENDESIYQRGYRRCKWQHQLE